MAEAIQYRRLDRLLRWLTNPIALTYDDLLLREGQRLPWDFGVAWRLWDMDAGRIWAHKMRLGRVWRQACQ